MRIHSLEWFKKNCRFERATNGYYSYKDKNGYMPLMGADLCGKKVIKIGNLYRVPGGVKINNTVVERFSYMPGWFFDKRELELE